MGRENIVAFMDDVVIPCRTIEEGLTKLREFLEIMKEEGLTLRLSNCRFLEEKIDFLGFEVDGDGMKPGTMKTDAIRRFKQPENVHEVRQFLGLASFFRKFEENHAQIVKQLTLLTRKNSTFQWGEEQETAFQEVKRIRTERPVLSLYDVKAEHQVHTDASKIGLAGILLQRENSDTSWKPVAFFSRQTTTCESMYHSFELEALSVVETIHRFRIYLLGKKFTVCTDCSSLKTAMSKRDIIPRIGR